MNAASLHKAKRTALSDLIRQMRKMEMADKAEDDAEGPDAHGGMAEDDVIEPDMSDMTPGTPKMDDESEEPDEFSNFMRHGSKMAPRGRVTVAISALRAPKGPKAPMNFAHKGRKP